MGSSPSHQSSLPGCPWHSANATASKGVSSRGVDRPGMASCLAWSLPLLGGKLFSSAAPPWLTTKWGMADRGASPGEPVLGSQSWGARAGGPGLGARAGGPGLGGQNWGAMAGGKVRASAGGPALPGRGSATGLLTCPRPQPAPPPSRRRHRRSQKTARLWRSPRAAQSGARACSPGAPSGCRDS